MQGRNIAERLRERAADHRENGWELMREGDPTLLENAANEIERLRRVVDDLLSHLNGISRQTSAMVEAYKGIKDGADPAKSD